jgi:hypothetical protein
VLLVLGAAVGAGEGEAYWLAAGLGAGAFHADDGMNENARDRKKWISKNETNAAPIAPEM